MVSSRCDRFYRTNSLPLMATAAEEGLAPYSIPQEFVDFRETIRQIARERVAPRAAEIDEKAEYPQDIRELFAEHDLFGLPFDAEHGGTGTGTLMLNVAVEEVARACASSALILMIQELGTLPIRLFGSDELKQRFLPRCASGEWTPAFALSEPEAGSDPGGVITRAVRDGDEWGIKGSPTGQPVFEDVRVPAGNLIGADGKGMHVALGTLDHSRLGVAAQAVGIAQGATDHAVAYARERRQFGRSIADFQGIQFKLADMETRTAAARELLYRACAKIDRGDADAGKYSAMA